MSEMKYTKCNTQAELDEALKRGERPKLIAGEFSIYDSSTVHAYGSSTVHAYGSSTVHAYDSSTVHAYDSSTVRAYGSSTVRAYGSSTVRASKFNAVTIHGAQVKASGGVQIKIPEPATAKEWCDFHGVEIKKGVAVLFKAVDEDYSTARARLRKIFYKPGDSPQAPDWDGGKEECGGGLHFAYTPMRARAFNPEAKHLIACPVKVAQIAVHKNPSSPSKIKAPGLCAPCWEVDIDGNKIAGVQ